MADDPTRLFVIGDSISIAYGPALAMALGDAFTCDRKEGSPADEPGPDCMANANGGDSRQVLAYLEYRMSDPAFQPDILLLNAGLHDVKRYPEAMERQVSPDAYARHLGQILDLAGQRAADVRWILTTPVIEDRHNRDLHRGFARYNADIDACNTCARALATERGVPCLDLAAATARFGPEARRYRPDGVHFTPETAREQGRWLAEQCRTGRAADLA